MLALVVKDESTAGLDRCYRLNYYSHDQIPGEELFGGLRPGNLYKDEALRDTFNKYLQLFTKFNIFLDLVIKRKKIENLKEDIFMIVDGKTKAYHLE